MEKEMIPEKRHSNILGNNNPSTTNGYKSGSCNIYDLLFIASLLVFLTAWIIIDLGKFYSMHSYVFDLGYNIERLWQPFNIINIPSYEFTFFNSAFQFVLSPLFFFHNLQVLLILQVIAFGASSIPLYALAKTKLRSRFEALIIATSFMIYFPASGILWFDFHIQSFFIPLFIFGYYFHVKGKYLTSALLLILSGTVRFPYPVFPIFFSLYDMLEILFYAKLQYIHKRKLISDFVVFFVSGFILLGGVFVILLSHNSTGISFMSKPLPTRLLWSSITALAIIGPVLFIPVTKIRWLLLSFPFLLLGLFTGSNNYLYPLVYQLQYTSMVVPPLFLGIIDALGEESLKATYNLNRFHVIARQIFSIESKFRTRLLKNRKKIVVCIFSILILGSIIFQPYGPLNSTSPTPYGMSKVVNFNTSNYKVLTDMINLIPENNSNVLFQNDMPEVLPRPELNNTYFLFSIYISSNLTISEVKNNTFPLNSAAPVYPSVKYVKVDYLLAFTKSNQYYLKFGENEATLPQIVSLMMSSGKYGIVAEESGFVLLERNYESLPKIFKPYTVSMQFGNSVTSVFGNVTSPALSNTYVSLVPGSYRVTFGISVTNNSNDYHLSVGLKYNIDSTDYVNVSGSYFSIVDRLSFFSFDTQLTSGAYFARPFISENRTLGEISVYRVYFEQIGY